jgi:ABC-type molybdate transport system substrate-binding protein
MNIIKLLLISITALALFGCSASRYITSIFHEEAVSIYASTSYPDQLKDYKNKKLRQ